MATDWLLCASEECEGKQKRADSVASGLIVISAMQIVGGMSQGRTERERERERAGKVEGSGQGCV